MENEYWSNNAEQKTNVCPQCGRTVSRSCKFCPDCGCKLNIGDNQSQKQTKIVIIVFVSVIVILLSVIAGLITNKIYKPTAPLSEAMPTATASQTTEVPSVSPSEPSQSIDDRLNEVKMLYDSGDYKAAQKKLYSINEDDLNALQRENYKEFEAKIDDKLNSDGTVSHAHRTSNYELSIAYVSGAETGNVYFWTDSSGDSYSSVLSNGNMIYSTRHTLGGRTLVKYNGSYGWITSRYISYSNRNLDPSEYGYHIGGASSGRVYVWNTAYSSTYITTIPNGTSVVPTGYSKNGRTEIVWNDGYAWITSEYVR